jgi:predicted enzyme related to lactoylglutathione lyase
MQTGSEFTVDRVLAGGTWKESRPLAQIERIDAVTIYTETPDALAVWYAPFGLITTDVFDGGRVGTIRASSGAFTFALILPRPGAPVTGNGAVVLTFHVSDFADFLAELAAHNIAPVETQQNANGHFALFRDPEGNHIELWSA